MSPQAKSEIHEACQIMVGYLQRMPCARHSQKWLRDEMVDMLANIDNQNELSFDYEDEYEYADVANPYLVEVLKAYDAE